MPQLMGLILLGHHHKTLDCKHMLSYNVKVEEMTEKKETVKQDKCPVI